MGLRLERRRERERVEGRKKARAGDREREIEREGEREEDIVLYNSVIERVLLCYREEYIIVCSPRIDRMV